MQRVYKILGGLVAVVGALILAMKLFGPAKLPDCKEKQTEQLLADVLSGHLAKTLLASAYPPQDVRKAMHFSYKEETAWDRDAQTRSCAALLDLTLDGKAVLTKQKVLYTLDWQNREDKKFRVQAHLAP